MPVDWCNRFHNKLVQFVIGNVCDFLSYFPFVSFGFNIFLSLFCSKNCLCDFWKMKCFFKRNFQMIYFISLILCVSIESFFSSCCSFKVHKSNTSIYAFDPGPYRFLFFVVVCSTKCSSLRNSKHLFLLGTNSKWNEQKGESEQNNIYENEIVWTMSTIIFTSREKYTAVNLLFVLHWLLSVTFSYFQLGIFNNNLWIEDKTIHFFLSFSKLRNKTTSWT